jgi:manganese efflux pump family protein
MLVVILLALGLAMDSLGASIVLGSHYKHSVFKQALLSSLLFGFFQAVMPLVGWALGTGFNSLISGIDHWIVFILLLIIGIKMIAESLEALSKEFPVRKISIKRLLSLSFSTSIDALVAGMMIPFLGVSSLVVIITIGLVTFSLSMLGVYLGKKSSLILKNKAGVFGGAVLILIGFKILTSHLFF